MACLSFDLGCVGFARRFARLREETVQRDETPAETRDRQRAGKHPQVTVPKYSEAELLKFLGVDPQDDQAVAMAHDLTEADVAGLDALAWGDGDG